MAERFQFFLSIGNFNRNQAESIMWKAEAYFMFGWLNKWRAQRFDDYSVAQNLIAQHGDQARHVLIAQIHEQKGRGLDCKRAYRVLKHVRNLEGNDGLDTATRMTEKT
jgi:hypothetical protein